MAEGETPSDTPEFEAQLKDIREVVEKQDTPIAHGMLGEFLYTTRKDQYMKEAIPHLEIAANGGLAAAKSYLGDAYFNGRGVDKDVSKGMDYFYDAAMESDVDALYSIGAAMFIGKDVPADYDKALDFLAQASSLGSARASNTLGLMYLGGFGTEQNIPKAKRLFTKAAQKGNKLGRQNLDMIAKQGRRFDYHAFILESFEKEDEPAQ